MSGVAVIRHLLANAAGVTAVVPAARIFSGIAPISTDAPYISVSSIVDQERLTAAMTESNRLREERVQVTVVAKTYAAVKSLLALVRAACPNQSGTVNGVKVDSILPLEIGPDLYDHAAKLCEQSRDFRVKWTAV